MVEIYDIMNITCQNLYHMRIKPRPRVMKGSRVDTACDTDFDM